MLRVMLVDDEPLALEGLNLLIDWGREGFSVCACAGSGEAALEALEASRPHLIVTDIRMAGMSGLEMMTEARRRGYGGAFVVVSGHSDFEYAQKAMALKVSGYLLKPVDPREAAEVLENVRKELIDQEIKFKLPLAAYQQEITSLLMGEDSKADALPGGFWQLMTWGVPLSYDSVNAILDSFGDTGLRATTHIVDGREWLVLHSRESIEKAPMQALEKMLKELGRQYVAGQKADSAEGMVAEYRQICARLDDCAGELVSLAKALVRAVSLLQREEFERLAEDMAAFCLLRGSKIKARAWELVYNLCVQQLSASPDKLARLLREPVQDIKALGDMVMRLLAPAPRRISDQVAAYLNAHYAQPITLSHVATKLGYNATYLGRIFKEETGLGLREYLNGLRLHKAAEMMASSALPVHKIADAAGYPQYKLFLAHFKQRYGKTPMEYRQSISP